MIEMCQADQKVDFIPMFMVFVQLAFLLCVSLSVEGVATNIEELSFPSFSSTSASQFSSSSLQRSQNGRSLESLATTDDDASYYHILTNFGTRENYNAALGNPHRGLASTPVVPDSNKSGLVYSLEVFYVPFDQVVTNEPGVYSWDTFEETLDQIVSRYNHAVPRFYIHYPGLPLRLPPYLLDSVKMEWYSELGGGMSPNYNDEVLLKAIKFFILEFGRKYDGDVRLHAIQMGLLGYWGEWHNGPHSEWIGSSVRSAVLGWFDDAFDTTQIQARYPHPEAYQRGFGLHDDSFTWSTIDGVFDAGAEHSYYFLPTLVAYNLTDFWKRGVMGGEVRPENVDAVFTQSYPAGKASNKQDFYFCSQMTHSTYNKVGAVFANFNLDKYTLDKARWNSARMGYNYQIQSVSAKLSNPASVTTIDLDVVLEQIGIAPFYYPLSLTLTCSGVPFPHAIAGVDRLIEQYSVQTFRFRHLPATPECLSNLTFGFRSNHVYDQRPIKFAQGDTGFISFKIPLPSLDEAQKSLPPPPIMSASSIAADEQTNIYGYKVVRKSPPIDAAASAKFEQPLTSSASKIELTLYDVLSKKTLLTFGDVDTTIIDLSALGVPPLRAPVQSGLRLSSRPNATEVNGTLTLVAAINIEGNPVGRVEFDWVDVDEGGQVYSHVEKSPPYTMGGNMGTEDKAPVRYLSTVGSNKEVFVTAVSAVGGRVIATRTINFDVVLQADDSLRSIGTGNGRK